ncbi:MAG: long-chain fatty acid--CoA ligase [Bacteroidetes bacterium]|nr:MAG: long-chain fatty acid--CoA ligase [Bacteroidota bacterium]
MRLFDILYHYHSKFPKDDCLVKKEGGKWIPFSTKDFIDYSENLACGLLALGVQREDKIAILANNRPEWNCCDMAVQMSGCILIPIYPTVSEKDLEFILNDAQVKYVFISSDEIYKKVKSVLANTPCVKEVYTFNDLPGVKSWKDVIGFGKAANNKTKLESIKGGIRESDLATILYTSGTTGTPKGVMLSHNNIFSNVHAVRELPPCDHNDKALSFLPLNHIYERMLNYLYLYLGISVYYAESLETIGDNLREIKPHIFSCVPRLLEKVYDKILSKGNELAGIKRKLFFWALALGEKYDGAGKHGAWYNFQLNLANKIIFSKWREALGGNVRAAVSGGAALNPRLARIFWSAQIPILEGYGLTETSPVIAVNTLRPQGMKFGTVGEVIEKVTVKIAEDGEILCKGPNVMMGYYKRPDATAEVIDKDGWFHTGDIGIVEEGKYLKITDRKKEIFKTSGGKYIAPQMIENKLKEISVIEQVMIVGENQKFASALIVPSFIKIKDMYAKQGKTYPGNEEAIKNPEILKIIKDGIDAMNKGLAQYETIKKIELLPKEWTIDGGELTPKLSLKRKVIMAANKHLLEKIYSDK